MNKEVYLVDEGVLLTKNDREFEGYNSVYDKNNSVYDKKYCYYDEDQYYVSDLETAIKDAKEYIENGAVGAYAIVSKSAINVDCIVEETPVEGETYFMDSVVYSVVKADDGVVENFFDKNFSIRQQEYLEEEER